MAATTVRNLRDGGFDRSNPDHVYIGRASSQRGLAASRWANPFPVKSEGERELALQGYAMHLEHQPALKAAIPELRGKTLWCWCAPKACHGHLLAALADKVPA